MTKDEALKQALLALEFSTSYLDELADVHGVKRSVPPKNCSTAWYVARAITACREALAQKEDQELVGEAQSYESTTRYTHCIWDANVVPVGTKLYTAPPKRNPLPDECINEIANSMPGGLAGFMKGWGWQQFARAIEAAHVIGAEHDAMD